MRTRPSIQMLLLLVLSALLALAANSLRGQSISLGNPLADRDGIAPVHGTAPQAGEAVREHPSMKPSEAILLLEESGAAFIDARSPDEYGAARIPGALNIPPSVSREELAIKTALLANDGTVIVYCSDPYCDRSRDTADLLVAQGFDDVRVMEEGIQGWIRVDGRLEEGR